MSLDYAFRLRLTTDVSAPTEVLEKPLKTLEKRSKNFIQSYSSPKAAFVINKNPNVPPQYFSGPQLQTLYNIPKVLPVSTSTKRVTIAIVIAFSYPGLLADLKTYWKSYINFGPNAVPPVVNIRTMPGATFNEGWAQEECLDVQMVCVANPNANIWVVEAKSDLNDDLIDAVNYATNIIKADIISMSWGTDDTADLLSYNKNFTDPTKCYCVSSGDDNVVCWPAVLPNCIAVGGTTLSYLPNSPLPRSEFTWSGAGCGYSATIPQPNYQLGIPSISHNYRVTPDVSLIANFNNGVYSVYAGEWTGVGGTSVSAPIFAGMLSVANQRRFNIGKGALTTVYSTTPNLKAAANYIGPQNNVQNYLYKTIYPNPTKYAQDFNDVIVGNNVGSMEKTTTTMALYNSGKGYDVPTGLGSPNCANLCIDLATI